MAPIKNLTFQLWTFYFMLFSNVDISSAISVTREGEAFFWAFCCHSSCRCCCPPLKGQRGVKILKDKFRRWRIPIFCIVGGCCYIALWYFPFYHISHFITFPILSHFLLSPFAPLQFPLLLHLSRGTFLPPSARVPFQSNSRFTFLLHHIFSIFLGISWHFQQQQFILTRISSVKHPASEKQHVSHRAL